MRRASKRDANEAEIVRVLRQLGVFVYVLNKPVDLLCANARGVISLIEVKNKDGKNEVTKEQAEFFAAFPGEVHIVRNADEAVRAVLGAGVVS